jgi:hypothetical protein
MSSCPWIDPQEVDALQARYPMLPRSRIELALEAYWPIKDDVEVALLALAARQYRESGESLDYTPAS